METCPCGSAQPYSRCCEPLILGAKSAPTPEALMRARYSAYAKTEVDFIIATTHPDKREGLLTEGIRRWSERSTWHGLEMIATDVGADDLTGSVEFIAHYTEKNTKKKHHELAQFARVDGTWYFSDGTPIVPAQFVRPQPKVGRNEPCPCGSGKKHKKCCAAG
ncbi:MAG: YchJ family protein [Deltaproteobacteria bacterium]|nr:YchJ family protein [Deltaproteobacteria bacterium]